MTADPKKTLRMKAEEYAEQSYPDDMEADRSVAFLGFEAGYRLGVEDAARVAEEIGVDAWQDHGDLMERDQSEETLARIAGRANGADDCADSICALLPPSERTEEQVEPRATFDHIEVSPTQPSEAAKRLLNVARDAIYASLSCPHTVRTYRRDTGVLSCPICGEEQEGGRDGK